MRWIVLESDWFRGLVAKQMSRLRDSLIHAGDEVLIQAWPEDAHGSVLAWIRLAMLIRRVGAKGILFDHPPSILNLWLAAGQVEKCIVCAWEPRRHPLRNLPVNVSVRFPSEPLARAWVYAGLPAGAAEVVPAQADPGSRGPAPRSRDARRVICCLGPTELRAVRQVLWAMHILSYADPDLELIVQGLGECLTRCRAFAKAINMEQRTHFLTLGTNWETHLNAADAVWVPTAASAHGDLTCAAIARGLPVIAHPGIVDSGLIPAGPNRHRVAHDTPPAWAGLTLDLLTASAANAVRGPVLTPSVRAA